MADLSSFHFLRPGWLGLLAVAAAVIWLIARRGDSRRTLRKLIVPHLLEALLVKGGKEGRLGPVPVLACMFAIGITAMAGPAWRREPPPFTEDRAALVIVLKVTPSMLTRDLQPSRLERSVHKIRDVLARRPGARASLVAYAGSAHLVMPLTRDADILNAFAGELRPELMPRDGDDPATALALAARQLTEANQPGSILLITDGLPAAEAGRMADQRQAGAVPLVLLGGRRRCAGSAPIRCSSGTPR
jgi:Ca-activated chloride channel family protein